MREHEKYPLGWWSLLFPVVLLFLAVMYGVEGLKRLVSGHCLLCPHHAIAHRGACRFYFEGNARGKIDPTPEEIQSWDWRNTYDGGTKKVKSGGSRPCPCRLFLGNPWGKSAEYDPDFGK